MHPSQPVTAVQAVQAVQAVLAELDVWLVQSMSNVTVAQVQAAQ